MSKYVLKLLTLLFFASFFVSNISNANEIDDKLLDAYKAYAESFDKSLVTHNETLVFHAYQKSFLIDVLKVLIKVRGDFSNGQFLEWHSEFHRNIFESDRFSPKNKQVDVSSSFGTLIDKTLVQHSVALKTKKEVLSDEGLSNKVDSIFRLLSHDSSISFAESDSTFISGLLKEIGFITEKDLIAAQKDYSDCAKDSNSFCFYGLARILLLNRQDETDFLAGMKLLEEAAAMSNPLAQFDLAQLKYLGSMRVDVDETYAFELFQMSSKYVPTAHWWLSLAYSKGYNSDESLNIFDKLLERNVLRDSASAAYAELISIGDHSPQLIFRLADELLAIATRIRLENPTNSSDEDIGATFEDAGLHLQNLNSWIHPFSRHQQAMLFDSFAFQEQKDAKNSPYLLDRHFDLGRMLRERAQRVNDPAKKLELLSRAFDLGDHGAAYYLARQLNSAVGENNFYNPKRANDLYGIYLGKNLPGTVNFLESVTSLARSFQYGSGAEVDLDKAVKYFNIVIDHVTKQFNPLSTVPENRARPVNGVPIYNTEQETRTPYFLKGYAARQLMALMSDEYKSSNKNEFKRYMAIACSMLLEGSNTEFILNGEPIWDYLLDQDPTGSYARECAGHLVSFLETDESFTNERILALGHLYSIGIPGILEKDLTKSFEYFSKSAKRNSPEAMSALGVFYLNGLGIQADTNKALSWWEKASNLGNAEATNNLANLYQNGGGAIEVDLLRAISLYQKAADQKDTWALPLTNLGLMYKYGHEGIPSDGQRAKAAFTQAYKRDGWLGGLLLAEFLELGVGGTRDIDYAKEIYTDIEEKTRISARRDDSEFALNAFIFHGTQLALKRIGVLNTWKKDHPWFGQEPAAVSWVQGGYIGIIQHEDSPYLKTYRNIDKTSYTPIEISREDLAILYEAIDLTMKKKFPQHYENKDLSPDIPVGQYFALVIGNYDYEYLAQLGTVKSDVQDVAKM